MSLIYKITNRKSFVDLNFKLFNQWVYEIYKSAYLDIIMISIFIKFTKVMHCLLLSFNSCVILWTFMLTRSFTFRRAVRPSPTKSADRPGRNRRHLWPLNVYKSPIDLNWPDFYQNELLDEDQFLVPIFTSASRH